MFSMNGSQLLKKGFQQSVISQNERRKEHSRRLLDMYDDSQLDILQEHIQRLYAGKRTAQDIFPVTLNFLKKITDRLSSVYCVDAIRSLADGTDRDTLLFSNFEKNAGLGIKLKQCNKISTLCGNALVKILWRNGKAAIDLYYPDEYDITCDGSPENISSVCITNYNDDNQKEYTLWTDSTVSKLNYNYDLISQEENVYKTLPFIHIFKQSPVNVYWLDGLNSLASAQQACNLLLSELFYILRMQGFGVPVLSGNNKSNSIQDAIGIGPSAFLSIPENASFDFKSTKAPIQDILSSLDFVAKQQAVNHGLPADSMSTEPTAESGISKIVSSAELMEQRADSVSLFSRYERQIFDLWRTVNNYHNTEKVSNKASLTVNFHEIKAQTTPLDELKTQEMLLNLGLCDLADIMQMRDPDLSREQALVKLLEIKDFNQEFNKVNTI